MTGRAEALLRHRGAALHLGTWTRDAADRLSCSSRGEGPWRWADLLEGAAQCAGLLAGMQPGGPCNTAVIAEYRDVALHADAHVGPVRFAAHIERRVLRFWLCRVAVHAADGTLLLAGSVAVAPEAASGR